MHSTDSLNDGYLGSGSELSRSIKKYGKECHITKIKEFVPNRKKLRKREAEVVNEEMLKNPLCMNLCKGGKGFDTTGLVTIKDKDDNTFSVSINDPRYLSGELTPIIKGKVIVQDKNGNKFQVSNKDLRYLSGELVGVNKGMITIKNKNGKCFNVSVNDPRYLSGELVSIWKGRKHSNKTINKMKQSQQGKQKGEKNSQYGTCWITNGTKNKKIYKGDLISENWKLGRKTIKHT
jgi:uncharacterized cupin superfamily protein